MKISSLVILLCSLQLVVSVFAGCRFEMPTASETRNLSSKGVFPGASPAWVRQDQSSDKFKASSSGVIPHAYTTPPAVQIASGAVPNVNVPETEANYEGRVAGGRVAGERALGVAEIEEDDATRGLAIEDSPLGRISESCPGLDAAVSEALRTEILGNRIPKYEQLVRRCPESEDLWIWLGKDYQSAGMLVEALRAYENALQIDNSNEVARALQISVKKDLNKPAGKGQ